MLMLVLGGCMSIVSAISGGPDVSYEELEVSAVDVACDGDVMSIDALVAGSGVSSVDFRVKSDSGAVQHRGQLAQDLSGTSTTVTRWSVGDLSTPCDQTWSIELDVASTCDDASGTASWAAPEVAAALPEWGPVTGGTSILIGVDGGSYDFSSAQVALGTGSSTWTSATNVAYYADASTCAPVGTSACLAATTPAFASTGTVDLLLTDATGRQVIKSAAFTYMEDLGGQAVGLVRAQMMSFDPAHFWLGSSCGDIGSATQYVQFDMLFHQPIDGDYHYWDAYPAPGECEWGPMSWEQVDVGSYLRLEGDATGSVMLADAGGGYYCMTDATDFAAYPGTTVDIEIVDPGTSTIVPQVIADAVRFPALMTSTSFDDPSQPGFVSAGPTATRGEELTLTWSNPGDLDGLNYSISAVSGMTVLGTVSCSVDPDTGELILPWRELVTDPAWDTTVTGFILDLTFWLDTRTTLPHDNSVVWERTLLFTESWLDVVEPASP